MRLVVLERNEGPRRRVKWRIGVVCFGTLFVLGACVQIAGIEDAHPRDEGMGGAGGETGEAGGAGGCTNASQCPDSPDACKIRTCTNQVCGFDYSIAGTPCNQTGVCNAMGACEYDNGQTCTSGGDCVSGYCVDGTCCGASSCAEGATCVTGQCVCPATTPNTCSGVCKDLATDNDNCGVCGKACASTEACEGSTCASAEWAGWPMPNPVGTGLPNPANYTVDAANGIVTDNVTKLMWQRNIDAGTYTWANAKTYCANLIYGGYSDWRLPATIELVSLIDFTKANPSIDSITFPGPVSNQFWTSSPRVDNSASAWTVNFIYGGTISELMSMAYYARCVR